MGNGNDTNRCFSCGGACCRYLTVQVDTPRSILDFDNLLWKLYHEQVQLFKDADGWYLLINNLCRNLSGDGRCMIYDKRPHACREHSADNCDADNPIEDVAEYYFPDADALETYCRKRFRRWDRRHAHSGAPSSRGAADIMIVEKIENAVVHVPVSE